MVAVPEPLGSSAKARESRKGGGVPGSDWFGFAWGRSQVISHSCGGLGGVLGMAGFSLTIWQGFYALRHPTWRSGVGLLLFVLVCF